MRKRVERGPATVAVACMVLVAVVLVLHGPIVWTNVGVMVYEFTEFTVLAVAALVLVGWMLRRRK